MVTRLKRTSLYDSHISEGAKMVDFHGFELPIWFTSIQEEHLATRNSAGIFDVSHMGFFRFLGDNVLSWLSSVSTQDYMKFKPGKCGYSHFLDENGFIIDDMIFAVSSESEVFGVPNATMIDIVYNWLSKHLPDDGSIEIEDISHETSIIALQGPKSSIILEEILGPINNVRRFRCQEIQENPLGISGWIQGTGYTGESGVEIFIPNSEAPLLWDSLISNPNVVPVGLGARDTLRLEKGYLLSGQDFLWPGKGNSPDGFPDNFLSRTTFETAVPYGLSNSHEYIGREKLIDSMGGSSMLWGLICRDRGPSPRSGHAVFDSEGGDSELIGFVTSGAPSPSLKMVGIAMGYLSSCEAGQEVWIQSSKRKRVRAEVLKPPFI